MDPANTPSACRSRAFGLGRFDARGAGEGFSSRPSCTATWEPGRTGWPPQKNHAAPTSPRKRAAEGAAGAVTTRLALRGGRPAAQDPRCAFGCPRCPGLSGARAMPVGAADTSGAPDARSDDAGPAAAWRSPAGSSRQAVPTRFGGRPHRVRGTEYRHHGPRCPFRQRLVHAGRRGPPLRARRPLQPCAHQGRGAGRASGEGGVGDVATGQCAGTAVRRSAEPPGPAAGDTVRAGPRTVRRRRAVLGGVASAGLADLERPADAAAVRRAGPDRGHGGRHPDRGDAPRGRRGPRGPARRGARRPGAAGHPGPRSTSATPRRTCRCPSASARTWTRTTGRCPCSSRRSRRAEFSPPTGR